MDRNHSVAMSDNGTATILCRQSNGTREQVYLTHYIGSSWTAITNLVTQNLSFDTSSAQAPDIAMDLGGNIVVSWEQSPGTSQILKSEYRNSTWSYPLSETSGISVAANDAFSPRVAMSDFGPSFITYRQIGPTYTQVFLSQYLSGAWVNPSGIDAFINPDGSLACGCGGPYINVAMNMLGASTLTWSQMDGAGIDQIYKSDFLRESWSHPTGLSDNISPDVHGAYAPVVARSDNGDAIIAWRQSTPTDQHIFISEYR